MHARARGVCSGKSEGPTDEWLLPYSPIQWLWRYLTVPAYAGGLVWLIGLPFYILASLLFPIPLSATQSACLATLLVALTLVPACEILQNRSNEFYRQAGIPRLWFVSAEALPYYVIALFCGILRHWHVRPHAPLELMGYEAPVWPLWLLIGGGTFAAGVTHHQIMRCASVEVLQQIRWRFHLTLLAFHGLLMWLAYSLYPNLLPAWAWAAAAGTGPIGIAILELRIRRNRLPARTARRHHRKSQSTTQLAKLWPNPTFQLHLRRVWDDRNTVFAWAWQLALIVPVLLAIRSGHVQSLLAGLSPYWIGAGVSLLAQILRRWSERPRELWREDARNAGRLEQLMLTQLSSRDLLLGRLNAAMLVGLLRSLPFLIGGSVLSALLDPRYPGIVWGLVAPAMAAITVATGCSVPHEAPPPGKNFQFKPASALVIFQLAMLITFGFQFWNWFPTGSGMRWSLLAGLHWTVSILLAGCWFRLQVRNFDELRIGLRTARSESE